jgi:hypothetical protein
MNVRGIAAILRRQPLATAAVLVIAASITCGIESAPVTYVQSATVVFTLDHTPADAGPTEPGTKSPGLVNPYIEPLITTEVMMTQVMVGPAAQSQVRAAGGTAQLGMTPENLYSLQYPDYAEPSASLTATSTSTAAVRRTFTVAAELLARRLAALQAQAGVPARDRITTVIIGDTGPVAQPGSRPRLFGGIAVMTIVALVMLPVFLDRHRNVIRPLCQVGRRRRPSHARRWRGSR